MELKLVLDFDGVLFNSAFEAFSVCNRAVDGSPRFRHDVSFDEFTAFRPVVTDAWQYSRLYDDRRRVAPGDLAAVAPDEMDWDFAHRFFAARDDMMVDPEWPKLMAPYDFFFLVRPLLRAHHACFAILSTRDVGSVRRTLAFHDAEGAAIFGQQDIRAAGSKVAVAEGQGWLGRDAYLVVYVDDMNGHLEPFDGRVHLPLHAGWGYGVPDAGSLSQHQVFTILASLLKLAAAA